MLGLLWDKISRVERHYEPGASCNMKIQPLSWPFYSFILPFLFCVYNEIAVSCKKRWLVWASDKAVMVSEVWKQQVKALEVSHFWKQQVVPAHSGVKLCKSLITSEDGGREAGHSQTKWQKLNGGGNILYQLGLSLTEVKVLSSTHMILGILYTYADKNNNNKNNNNKIKKNKVKKLKINK